MWLRSKCNYTEEDLSIIYHALFIYSIDLRTDSEENYKVNEIMKKINKEYESLINNNS